MIGIALWENTQGRTGLTGMWLCNRIVGQKNAVKDYIQRRVRWLRVRKYMVLLATLIEPTTESIICASMVLMPFQLFFGTWFNKYWFCYAYAYMDVDRLCTVSHIDKPYIGC